MYRHEPPQLHHTEIGGKPADYSMLGAETQVGDVIFELVQPMEGPSIYKEWVKAAR